MSDLPIRPTLLLSLLVLALAACAGGEATWTYSPAPSAEPTASPSAGPTASPSTGPTAEPTAPPSTEPSGTPGEARLIDLELTVDLQIKQAGVRVTEIAVTIGETIRFRVDNTAGFDHNLYIGPDDLLAANQVSGLTGIPTWTAGVQELTWQVPQDAASLKFGCTVPGHYGLMNGTIVVGP